MFQILLGTFIVSSFSLQLLINVKTKDGNAFTAAMIYSMIWGSGVTLIVWGILT